LQKFTGKEYLQIDIANHYGKDKELFKDRINWVKAHEEGLEYLTNKADDYFQYASAVMAYRKAQKGTATGYMVSMDACASGPQILSVIIGCKVGASNTGATGQTRKDTYKIVFDTTEEELGGKLTCTPYEIKYSFMP